MFTNPGQSANTPMANAPARQKFMFDRTFEADATARPAERKPVTLKPDQYDALKKESFDQGFADGHAAGLNEIARQVAATLALIDQRVIQLMDGMAAWNADQDAKTRQLVIVIARRIMPVFAAQNGLDEITAMLNDVMAEMVHEPRFVVRVDASQFDAINAKITEISQQKAYAGKVIVLADPAIACGDCRVEWADGGLERKVATTLDDVAAIITPEQSPS